MLRITIPETELFDHSIGEFIQVKEQTLQLEHSLVSLSKWESKWCKPFFSKEEKTMEETLDYVKCMTITQNVKPDVYKCLTNENMLQINNYIEAPMTATTFSQNERRKINGEQITAELIYYWMIVSNIPFECQKWHLNRLITLIRVCSVKSQPPKKMSKADMASNYAKINAARRKQFNSKG